MTVKAMLLIALTLQVSICAADDTLSNIGSVISGGGSPMASGKYSSNGTIGQSSPVINQDDFPSPPQTESLNNYPGFWYTVEAGTGCLDMNTFTVSYGSISGDPIFNRFCDFDHDNDVDGRDLKELLHKIFKKNRLEVLGDH